MSSQGEKQTRDFVDYQPIPVKVLPPTLYELARKHEIIISALRESILTVKEIHDLYLSENDGKHSITQKTVYRYLDELEEAEIVTVAGFRKTEGVKASERIYGRTATIFLMVPAMESQSIDDLGEEEVGYILRVATILGLALGYNVDQLDKEAFVDFFLNYWRKRWESLEHLHENIEGNQKLLETYTSMNLDSVNEALEVVQVFVPFIREPEMLEKLKQLYKKE